MLCDLYTPDEQEIREMYADAKDPRGWTSEYIQMYSFSNLHDFKVKMGLDDSQHLETGIYEFEDDQIPDGFDFDPTFEQRHKWNTDLLWSDDPNDIYVSDQGIADNLNQIKEYYKYQINDPAKKYVIITYKLPLRGGKITGQNKNLKNKWTEYGEYIGDYPMRYFDASKFPDPNRKYFIGFSCISLD